MLKKAFVAAAFVVAGIAVAVPAQASPNMLRADLGRNNGATLDARYDQHGVRSHVHLGGLTGGTYNYGIVVTWETANGDVPVTIPVCADTLKAGQNTLECGAERLNLFAGMPKGGFVKSYVARVTRVGAAGAVASGVFR